MGQEEMKEAFERKVLEMRQETDKSLHNLELGRMFSMDSSSSQQKFTNLTVGLQSHEQYKSKAMIFLNNNANENEQTKNNKFEPCVSPKKTTLNIQSNMLSFADNSDSNEEENEDFDLMLFKNDKNKKRKLDENESTTKRKKRKICKNPCVDTSFLPDAERDAIDKNLRLELEAEWNAKQEIIKRQRLEITYSYWDGSGHRRSIEIVKGMKIGDFLELVRKELSTHFSELRGIRGDYLLYVKDDYIIPHSLLFYDLICTKTKGKSGHWMFKNQCIDKDDYCIDKDCGHPGKVITRSWHHALKFMIHPHNKLQNNVENNNNVNFFFSELIFLF